MLKHITIKQCPICGCSTIIKEEIMADSGKIRTHCNGERWETRTFLCNYAIEWIPNYSDECVKNLCDNDPKTIAIKQEKIELIKKIDSLDIEKVWKDRFKNNINSW